MAVVTDRPQSFPATESPVKIALATEHERNLIYRLRHEVYAKELHQHPENGAGLLRDELDEFNTYIVAVRDGGLVGFISITPPRGTSYSMDKYVDREQLPFPIDDTVYEARILTVLPTHRQQKLAALLMYAAFRWIEARGGRRVVAIGRQDILQMYLKAGFRPLGSAVRSGEVTYQLMSATMDELRQSVTEFSALLNQMKGVTNWQLGIPYYHTPACFHGGAFFETIGTRFESLDRREDVISADVLDAWFPPSPKVVETLNRHLPWLLSTSPPTHCEGLVATIADTRGVSSDCVLPGAGSSDLIYRSFRHWLSPSSRVLILDPTYGEYAYVFEQVIGCHLDRLSLSRDRGYEVDLTQLQAQLRAQYDLVVLVNPNSPTGCHVPRERLMEILVKAPKKTRIWIDETYVDYAGAEQSLEQYAAGSENVIVCKSMSKAYALSGARVAYLCASPHQLEELRLITPPWIVSLPAQVAAVEALKDTPYYVAQYAETRRLRQQLRDALGNLGAVEVAQSCANFLLIDFPETGPEALSILERCRSQGLFLRDPSSMGGDLGPRTLRIAVKDEATNRKTVRILADALSN